MTAHIHLSANELSVNGQRQRLQPKTMDILFALMCHPTRTAWDLIETIYPDEKTIPMTAAKVIHTRILHLRIELFGSGWEIVKHGWRGYSLEITA